MPKMIEPKKIYFNVLKDIFKERSHCLQVYIYIYLPLAHPLHVVMYFFLRYFGVKLDIRLSEPRHSSTEYAEWLKKISLY